jgi:hypothetical protein
MQVIVRKRNGSRFILNVSEAEQRPFSIEYHDMYHTKEGIDFALAARQAVKLRPTRSNGIPVAEFDNR